MEILCAYIRHNAPASAAEDHPFGDWEPLPEFAMAEEHAAHEERRRERFGRFPGEGQVRQWARSLPPPRADIAEALKVIGRRSPAQLRVEAAWPHPPGPDTAWPFDIPCPSLPARPDDAPRPPAEIAGFMEQLRAWRTRLWAYPGYRLDLRHTNLQGADMHSARLQGALLTSARMEGAALSQARMEGAVLWGGADGGGGPQ